MMIAKPLAVLGMVSALAIAAATPSDARSGRNAAIAAGVGGFAVGAVVGAAAANSSYGYYGPGYGSSAYYGGPAYSYGYDSYAYAPRPSYYNGDPSGYYAPAYSNIPRAYRPNGPAREDHLTGTGAGFID